MPAATLDSLISAPATGHLQTMKIDRHLAASRGSPDVDVVIVLPRGPKKQEKPSSTPSVLSARTEDIIVPAGPPARISETEHVMSRRYPGVRLPYTANVFRTPAALLSRDARETAADRLISTKSVGWSKKSETTQLGFQRPSWSSASSWNIGRKECPSV